MNIATSASPNVNPKKTYSMKRLLVFISSLTLFFSITNAMDVPGYIVKNTNDTIRGQIVYMPPKAKGKNGIYEIDTSMTWKVKFIAQDGRKENYKPKEIKGFGFQLNNTWHNYITVTPQQGIAGLGKYEFFGRRVIDGEIKGYIGTTGLEYFVIDEDKIYDWWFETNGKGLNGFIYDLFSTKKKKLTQELKYFFQMEDEFLETIPEKIEKERVYKIIRLYNDWKKK